MTNGAPDIRPQRISEPEIEQGFSDLHPPLTQSAALIEADRCYFCYDAPCITACPTGIDIPTFIQQIRSDNIRGSAKTILQENIMGGMCARVCPTEILCEDACVRNLHEDKPVEIGLLQRYATEDTINNADQLFERAPRSGKRVAVIGAGPAGLSCAHRLAVLGHDAIVFNRDSKSGGLNEYGIAAYKVVDDFAQREVDFIMSIGGIEVRNDATIDVDSAIPDLMEEYDAVFVAIGLADSNKLGIAGDDKAGVSNATDYIAELRQTADKSALPVGSQIVVIGGGMTAIDIAVQSKRLGAPSVHMAYRGSPEKMSASQFEQDLAKKDGVHIRYNATPKRILGDEHVTGVEFIDSTTQQTYTLAADIVFKAIGQQLSPLSNLSLDHGRIKVDENQRTLLERVWAGGDCTQGSDDLTVSAVQHGKIAAIDIDRVLRGKQ